MAADGVLRSLRHVDCHDDHSIRIRVGVLVRLTDALFTVCEPQALAGLLSGYRGLTRDA